MGTLWKKKKNIVTIIIKQIFRYVLGIVTSLIPVKINYYHNSLYARYMPTILYIPKTLI